MHSSWIQTILELSNLGNFAINRSENIFARENHSLLPRTFSYTLGRNFHFWGEIKKIGKFKFCVHFFFFFFSNDRPYISVKMLFISSKKLSLFWRYSNFCISVFHSCFPSWPLLSRMIKYKSWSLWRYQLSKLELKACVQFFLPNDSPLKAVKNVFLLI